MGAFGRKIHNLAFLTLLVAISLSTAPTEGKGRNWLEERWLAGREGARKLGRGIDEKITRRIVGRFDGASLESVGTQYRCRATDTKILFINGAWTTKADARYSAEKLAYIFQHPVDLVFEPSLGLAGDAVDGLIKRNSDGGSRSGARIVRNYIRQNPRTTILSHSRGCFAVQWALERVSQDERSQVRWISCGSPSPTSRGWALNLEFFKQINHKSDIVATFFRDGKGRFSIGDHDLRHYVSRIDFEWLRNGGLSVEAEKHARVLDAHGARPPLYLHPAPDDVNGNHRFHFRDAGDGRVVIYSELGGQALDANNGNGPAYLYSSADVSNPNHVWVLQPAGDGYCRLVPSHMPGHALDSDFGDGEIRVRLKDDKRSSQLWRFQAVRGDAWLIYAKQKS